jgi:rare lipoprotein A
VRRFAVGVVLMLCHLVASAGTIPKRLVASFYAHGFVGRKMANGQPYDPEKFTVASRTLPMWSWVTLKLNGRSVCAQVTDRGPWVRGRNLDVSYAVARTLWMLRRGVVTVEVMQGCHTDVW